MAIKILRSIQDGSEEEAPECHAENQVRHFSVILHEFSTKIHDPETLEGIWNPFAQSNFWFANLNWTPLVFLKPSSQVNNFTVFFHFFMGMSKSVFSICLG